MKNIIWAAQDGIVDPLDSTLRDFSGACIQEFVKWSIKQTTPKQQEKSPANIKSLFKRIYSLALHPNVFKRLGAALAFNSMYRQFRSVCEEKKSSLDELHTASQHISNLFYSTLSESKKSVANGKWYLCRWLSKYRFVSQRRELFGGAVCFWGAGGVCWESGSGPLRWKVPG